VECQRSSAGTAITPQPLPVAQPLGGDGVSGVGFDDNDQVWGRDGCSASRCAIRFSFWKCSSSSCPMSSPAPQYEMIGER
jgi:hypothetical protein